MSCMPCKDLTVSCAFFITLKRNRLSFMSPLVYLYSCSCSSYFYFLCQGFHVVYSLLNFIQMSPPITPPPSLLISPLRYGVAKWWPSFKLTSWWRITFGSLPRDSTCINSFSSPWWWREEASANMRSLAGVSIPNFTLYLFLTTVAFSPSAHELVSES